MGERFEDLLPVWICLVQVQHDEARILGCEKRCLQGLAHQGAGDATRYVLQDACRTEAEERPAIDHRTESAIRRVGGIPAGERLILMIAFGEPIAPHTRVAFSPRRPAAEIATLHA